MIGVDSSPESIKIRCKRQKLAPAIYNLLKACFNNIEPIEVSKIDETAQILYTKYLDKDSDTFRVKGVLAKDMSERWHVSFYRSKTSKKNPCLHMVFTCKLIKLRAMESELHQADVEIFFTDDILKLVRLLTPVDELVDQEINRCEEGQFFYSVLLCLQKIASYLNETSHRQFTRVVFTNINGFPLDFFLALNFKKQKGIQDFYALDIKKIK